MAIKDALISELKQEATLTKKILERVPLDKKDWKPHAKSTSLGRLATHIAEIPRWIPEMMTNDVYDFMAHPFAPHIVSSQEELLQIYQTNLDNAIATLEKSSDEDLDKIWTVKKGEHTVFSIPKKAAMRSWAFSHIFHHRGQLSVYLRLLDVPIPGMYGPSADER
jgi:uncharacterized damage-inducible protein DinB